ncbi:MAG TPA: alpha-L-fucosidase [Candidatus Hydrogenedens sp.]|nr:alpha-L-fucosidase [Candidatus Hydrogenedens sp.]HOK08749.1 alpha-L-fucosidase [Candidatus Hydrogenedens sp.]HOL20991.1 alpha-L-fucosidase [Candidatus Hydrogenedens sp.]HPP57557.1 alpha-L-fucosidase [Candidatus Hydrogenedens sp.]
MGIFLVLSFLSVSVNMVTPPEPLYPIPTPQQIKWHQQEMGMFCHFGINTFHNEEWTDGTKLAESFNPTDFNPQQWADVAKNVGMGYLILTVKHHDGFVLYPTMHTDYCVRLSPWQNGQGDVVKGVSEACKKAGIYFGFYLSPWDRHEPRYNDNTAYDEYFKSLLREVITNYGPVFEVWFDGAGTKGHKYDWEGYYQLIKQLEPNALIAICGPDIRWVGNEDGLAPETLWNVQERDGKKVWWPAECDVPIRKGQWFYHTDGENRLLSLNQLLKIYYYSVGRGAVLLLNVSPDRSGHLPEPDVSRLLEWRNVITETFKTNLAEGAHWSASNVRGNAKEFSPEMCLKENDNLYWATDDNVLNASITLHFSKPVIFDRVVLKEQISLGQRVEGHSIWVKKGKSFEKVDSGTTIGYKRIHCIPQQKTKEIRIQIDKSLACPTLDFVGIYQSSPHDLKTLK